MFLPLELMIDDPIMDGFIIQDMFTNYSTGYRTYKNTLMLFVSDLGEYNGLKECARLKSSITHFMELRELTNVEWSVISTLLCATILKHHFIVLNIVS